MSMAPNCSPNSGSMTCGIAAYPDHDLCKRLHTTGSNLTVPDTLQCSRNERSLDDLPEDVVMEILSRLPDARGLVQINLVSKTIQSAVSRVRCARFVCRTKEVRGGNASRVPFKEAVRRTLAHLKMVEQLRLEIEDEMQAIRYKDQEIESDIWLTKGDFVTDWVQPVQHSLQRLCVIDYGQQAIFHPSPLLQILSSTCKNLMTVELRNMFLDCKNCCLMTRVETLTLRCVKLTDKGLENLNECLPALTTLTLVTVVGLKEACFESDKLKVLCLGLATKVKSVRLKVRNLQKLQLKMSCPDVLRVHAPKLACLAVCMDRRDGSIVEFEDVNNLKELLMGASEFSTLTKLIRANALLSKVFMDVPCMQFDDNGGWKTVLHHVPLSTPDMEAMRNQCQHLEILSIGPGLWHALEVKYLLISKEGGNILQWPPLTRLIVHLIVRELEVSVALLGMLVNSIPTLTTLEVYVHADSPVDANDFCVACKSLCANLTFKWDKWKKGLRFECFSF